MSTNKEDPVRDEEYHESEDEDFNPTDVVEPNDDGNDSDNEPLPSYDSLQGAGGLVRTRAQRRLEKQQEQAPKVVGEASVDVDALWAEMNSTPAAPKAATTQSNADSQAPAKPANNELKEEYITIERTFKFAGKVETEKKTVLKSSAEGRNYVREQKQKEIEAAEAAKAAQAKAEAADAKAGEAIASDSSDRSSVSPAPQPARRPGPAKRKQSLLDEYNAGKAKKINTLEKSRLDWFGFVDKEGIQDDLKKHNKDGYLERRDFLNRVGENINYNVRAHESAANKPKFGPPL